MNGESHISATEISIRHLPVTAYGNLERALTAMALVDATGHEQDPLDVLQCDPNDLPTTAHQVINATRLAAIESAIVVVHNGPATTARAQGYADVLSDFVREFNVKSVTVRFDDDETVIAIDPLAQVRNRALVRWARDGLDERPAAHVPAALVLVPRATEHRFRKIPHELSLGDFLKLGAFPDHDGMTPTLVSAELAADQLAILSHRPRFNTRLVGVKAVGSDSKSVVGTINVVPRPATAVPERDLGRAMVTDVGRPHGAEGATVRRQWSTPDAVQPRRAGDTGRLVYMDMSALIAGIEPDWFHPDDRIFTCSVSAFSAAGVKSITDEHGHERITWITSRRIPVVPVAFNQLYSYGSRVLHMREKNVVLHPETTGVEVMATVMAQQFGAILATCLPERYKGLMPGLEIAHYQVVHERYLEGRR